MGNAIWKAAFIFWMRAYFLPEKRPSEEIEVKGSMDELNKNGKENHYIFILRERKEYAMIISRTTIYIDNFQIKTQDIVSYFYQ